MADVLRTGQVHASIFPELTGDLAERIKNGLGAEFSLSVFAPRMKPRIVPSANTLPVTSAQELTAWISEAHLPSKEHY